MRLAARGPRAWAAAHHHSAPQSRSLFGFASGGPGGLFSSSSPQAAEEFFVRIKSVNESVLKPLNARLLGPLDKTLDELSPLPMVLILGNHSSGKSTFINFLCGRQIQATGVAPTDDGFTAIAPGKGDFDQDGPSLVGDANMGFRGLLSFGSGLVNHVQLKVRKDLAISDLLLIDSPGMIDSPTDIAPDGTHSLRSKDRGYDFPNVVRWLAERADVILLFQDPAKPGTTGETLTVLTTALVGQEFKTLLILNKADSFTNVHDFARAYGALAWNLSKVIHRKDLPRIYTMCVPVAPRGGGGGGGQGASGDAAAPPSASTTTAAAAPGGGTGGGGGGLLREAMADLEAARAEIVGEVRRAPLRRVDNLITRLDDSARLLRLHAVLLGAIRKDYVREATKAWGAVAAGSGSLAALAAGLLFSGSLETGIPLLLAAAGAGGGGAWYAGKHLAARAAHFTDGPGVEATFRRTFYLELADRDEFLTQLFARVRPHLQLTLRTLGIASVPSVKRGDIAALDKIIDGDTPELRRAATKAGVLTGTTPGASAAWSGSAGTKGAGGGKGGR
jgi:hypothetical protein